MKVFLAFTLFFANSAHSSFENINIEFDSVAPTIRCETRVGYGRPVHGERCVFRDEVMTGIRSHDPKVILCSRLEVTCRTRTQTQVSQSDLKE